MGFTCAVLWDFDGTLAYTRADVWESLHYAAHKCGGELNHDFTLIPSNLGKSMEDIFREVKPFPGAEYFDLFVNENRRFYRTLTDYPNTYFYPGILEVLQWLIEHEIKNYVVSMKPLQPLNRIIEIKGWKCFFEKVLSAETFDGECTSKENLVLHLMEEEQLKRSHLIMVGDSASDIVAAQSVGITSIAVTYGDGDVDSLLSVKPDYRADEAIRLKDIFSVLGCGKGD